METVLKLSHVTKTYHIQDRELPILKDINIDIRPGEFVAIIGPSGSGKSTLLHLMGILDRPTSGSIYIHDQDVSQLDDDMLSHIRNDKIGFVFQSFFLLNYYTALDNVCLPLAYSHRKGDRREEGRRLLERVGLAQRMKHRPNELSGGERQRVAIARALINSPEILFADEPTGNLDKKTGEVIMEILKDINRRGTTLILITHDPQIAARAERVIHIEDGAIR